MPCIICNSLKVIDSEGTIGCPKCLNYTILNKNLKLNQLEEELIRVRKLVKKKLKKCNLEALKHSSIQKREELAGKIIQNIREHHKLLEEWFTLNLIISLIFSIETSNLIFPKNSDYRVNLEILYSQVNSMYKIKHLISLLKFDKIRYIRQENGEEVIYKTEKAPITSLSSIFKSSDIGSTEFEYGIFQAYFSRELEDLIKSELYSQYLKSYYNERILPFLRPSNALLLYFILKYIIDNFSYIGFPLRAQKGLISIVKSGDLKNILKEKFDQSEIESFFHNMIIRDSKSPSSFSFFYYNDSTKEIIIPYQSLEILLISIYSHVDLPKKGEESNIKGNNLEELIHSELQVYDLILFHPEDNSAFVGVTLEEKKYGDIDILGYNDEYVILIESKFWYRPTLQILEPEIEKFYQRCKYVENNLEQFGILKSKNEMQFIKMFYTPFAPYQNYKDILLFPTRFSIHFYLKDLLPMKKIKSISHDNEIYGILENASGRHPYAIDLSKINEKIPKNKYRLNDARIIQYNNNEIRLMIFNQSGAEYPIYCNLDPESYNLLVASDLEEGDYIKCILFNQLGNWARIQFISFKPVEYDDLHIRLLNLYRNAEDIDEIYKVFKKNKFDLEKLVNHCIRKNQSIYHAIGFVLAGNDSQSVGIQCDCGEIMHYDPQIYEKLLELYPNRNVKCKYCDPDYKLKLQMITGSQFYTYKNKFTDLDFKELQFSARKKEAK